MTVSDTRASASLGVALGVRMRGVAYDDLQAPSGLCCVGSTHLQAPAKLAAANLAQCTVFNVM